MGRGAPGAFAIVAAISLSATRALAASDSDQCIDANSKAQLLRREGKLESARTQLALCLSAGCPPPVRQDCAEQLDETGQLYLHQILQGVVRMRALIDDLLAYARVGAEAGATEPVSCVDVMCTVTEALSLSIAASGAELVVGELPTVSGPSGDLFQLFSNLVGNALKFVAPGERPHVEVDARWERDSWHFTVSDNGIGIEPQNRERVFRMFKRLHPVHAYEGTGIGLAICEKVVQRRHGRIWIDGAPGGGSVVHFTLPSV